MRISCPSCGRPNGPARLLVSLTGFHIRCPGCKTRIRFLRRPLDYFLATAVFCVVFAATAKLLDGFDLIGAVYFWAGASAVPAVVIMQLTLFAMRTGDAPEEVQLSRTGHVLSATAAVLAGIIVVGAVTIYVRGPGRGVRLRFPPPQTARLLGKVDADWKLTTLAGADTVFGEFRGRVVFLNVWATWCPPCVAELPGIEALLFEMKDAVDAGDLAVVLASREKRGVVQAFQAKAGHALPFFLYEGKLPSPLQTRGIPATFILNRKGEIVFRHTGSADWNTPRCRGFLRALIKKQ